MSNELLEEMWYYDENLIIDYKKNISIQFGKSNITKYEMQKIIPKLNNIPEKENPSIYITQNNITIFKKKAYLTYDCNDSINRHILCCIESNGYYYICGSPQTINIYYYDEKKIKEMRKQTNILELIPSQFKQSKIEPSAQINIQVNSNEELANMFANIVENAPKYINELIENIPKKGKTKIKRR